MSRTAKKLRIGCVGLGARARYLLSDLAALGDDVEIAALCDRQPRLYHEKPNFTDAQFPALKEQFPSALFFEDFNAMLDGAELDALMVETPATCHAEFCIKALQHNIRVYSDIPSVASLAEADALWRAERDSGAWLMTGATTCGWGFIRAMQDLAAKGLLGKPFFLEAEYIHDCREYWEQTPWRRPGPGHHYAPITYCTHSLGPLLPLVGGELRTVSAFSTGSHVTEIPEADDLMGAVLQSDAGITLRYTVSFINNCPAGHHSFRVFGTRGHFEYLAQRGDRPAVAWFSSKDLYGAEKCTELSVGEAPRELEEIRRRHPGVSDSHGGADPWLLHRFLEALRQNAASAPISLQQGLRMTLPGIYAQESANQKGKTIRILYPWDEDFRKQ